MSEPLVTAVMLTGHHPDRRPLAMLAIEAFMEQTWPNCSLLIINQGKKFHVADRRVLEIHLPGEKLTVGALRNIGLERAPGEFVITWDDDDYHRDDRIEYQVTPLLDNSEMLASVLRCYTVLDLPKNAVFARHCRKFYCGGCCGTMLLRTTTMRYREDLNRKEDSVFIAQIPPVRLAVLANDPAIYQRTYSGLNVSPRGHVIDGPKMNHSMKLSEGARHQAFATLARYRKAMGLS